MATKLANIERNGANTETGSPETAVSLWAQVKLSIDPSFQNGRISGHFDGLIHAGKTAGITDWDFVAKNRDALLRMGAEELTGSHGATGNVTVALGKALNAAVKRLRFHDKESKARFTAAWRNLTKYFALAAGKVELDDLSDFAR